MVIAHVLIGKIYAGTPAPVVATVQYSNCSLSSNLLN